MILEENKAFTRVTVEIFGQEYHLKSQDDAEYIKEIADMVDTKMRNVAGRTNSLAENRIGVMTALELADEYSKLKKDYDELVKLLEE